MDDGDPAKEERVWESGWDGHKRAQALRLARLNLAEKLAWLEEAQRVVRQLGKSDPRVSDSRS